MLAALSLWASVAAADPSGRRWALGPCGTSCPAGTTCITNRCVPEYRVAASIENTGGQIINGGLSYATVATRTRAAFAAWTKDRVSCNTSWDSVAGPPFATPAGLDAVDGTDHFNNIIWLSGSSWMHLANELALTTTTYYTANSEIFDADMELNNNVTWSDNLAANTYDAESVILHEAGHFLGLSHSLSATAVMYRITNRAESKRVLSSLDEADVCRVYPATAGTQGASCSVDAECSGGRACRSRSQSTSKICTQVCTTSSTCPAGYTCQAANTGMACLPQVGAPDQCRFCQSGSECSSGLCLRFDTGITFCSLSCAESAQCGPGYTCQSPEGFCVPDAMTCTNQCTTAAQCASGYTCIGGTCTPRGGLGDPCTISLFCGSCMVCTRESAATPLSFCRSCCAGSGLGGYCTACPNSSCGSSSTCAGLATGNSSVCVPSASAPTTCQPCNNGQCAEGLQCTNGRCRTSCNPMSPGTCAACFSLTSGSGACACNDEIASEGQPCGAIGNTLAACGTGLVCVGATSTVCRTRCELNIPNSCRTGQSCQSVSGQAVCMPGTEGSTCASCTNAGACNSGLTCYLGRCYEACNVNVSGGCTSCVQNTVGGVGICGCPDQVSPENGPCGNQPVRACQPGTRCLDGSCRARCDPAMPSTCPQSTSCQQIGDTFYCADAAGGGRGGGGGGGDDGGGGSDAGRGGGSGTGGGGGARDAGCGCRASADAFGSLIFLLLLAALTRRRS